MRKKSSSGVKHSILLVFEKGDINIKKCKRQVCDTQAQIQKLKENAKYVTVISLSYLMKEFLPDVGRLLTFLAVFFNV